MNTKTSLIVAGALALAALPSAKAGDAAEKFKQMDTNGDGRISHEEYIASEQARFAKLDTNGDGIISAAELAAGQETKKKNPLKFWEKGDKDSKEAPLSPTGKLGPADANADGQITREEQLAYAETTFTTLDADKDGSLTQQELEAGTMAAQPAK